MSAQGHQQAIGEKGYENVCLDALLLSVENGPQTHVVFEALEGRFNLHQLSVILPELSRILAAQIGSQQVAALTANRRPQLVFAKRKLESLRVDWLLALGQLQLHQSIGAPGL